MGEAKSQVSGGVGRRVHGSAAASDPGGDGGARSIAKAPPKAFARAFSAVLGALFPPVFQHGRSAIIGWFVKQPTVKRRPKTTVNEMPDRKM
jgi:hypothetical protein